MLSKIIKTKQPNDPEILDLLNQTEILRLISTILSDSQSSELYGRTLLIILRLSMGCTEVVSRLIKPETHVLDFLNNKLNQQ